MAGNPTKSTGPNAHSHHHHHQGHNDRSAPSTTSTTANTKIIHLDGTTLEGGGQLVRNAVALAALTGQAVQIDHVRGNRHGKKGLKGSHTAAIKFLAIVSGSEVVGAEIGSSSVTFLPPPPPTTTTPTTSCSTGSSGRSSIVHSILQQTSCNLTPLQPEYNIRLTTAGSVFLIFQAVYPYLLFAGARQRETSTSTYTSKEIRLNITGGTNVSFSPSYDYVAQVLVPNFGRLGLPRLEVDLRKRGWSTGPADLGMVSLCVSPVGEEDGENGEKDATSCDSFRCRFPTINLAQIDRGRITSVDITILAPDTPSTSGLGPAGEAVRQTVRDLLEIEVLKRLRRRLRDLPKWLFTAAEQSGRTSSATEVEMSDTVVPLRVHTSEKTLHDTHMYVLLVAHTSSGLKIGRDALYGAGKGDAGPNASSGSARRSNNNTKGPSRGRHAGRNGKASASTSRPDLHSKAISLVDRCVEDFIVELYDPEMDGRQIEETSGRGKRPCVDVHMRDQVVIFEALGNLLARDKDRDRAGGLCRDVDGVAPEDSRRWSLHTRTARWVCEQILGVSGSPWQAMSGRRTPVCVSDR